MGSVIFSLPPGPVSQVIYWPLKSDFYSPQANGPVLVLITLPQVANYHTLHNNNNMDLIQGYCARGRAKTKFSTGLEGQLYRKVTGPPLKSLALIFVIKMRI